MKSWRELGEVPDSDDDSFDDTDLLDENLNSDWQPQSKDGYNGEGTRVEENHAGPVKDADVWSVPSSPPEQALPYHSTNSAQASQTLTQFPWAAEPSPNTAGQTSPSTPTESSLEKPSSIPRNPAASNLPSDVFREDEISKSYVRVTSPAPSSSSISSLLSRTPTPPQSPSLPQTHLSPPPARLSAPTNASPLADIVDSEQLSTQTAVRLERSLRPRKPIQQHPYLLESVQYTAFMKSHGIKPVRVIQESRPLRSGAEDEDSQDTDFQAEESQETSADGLGGLDASGPVLFDDDEDELALTPSLPKTSPHGQQLRTSSQPTNPDQTDATSLSDEEFPPLERLHPVSAKERQRLLKRQRSQLLSSTRRKRPRFVPDSSSQESPRRPRFIPPPPIDIWDLSSSPRVPQVPEEQPQEPGASPKRPAERRPSPPSAPIPSPLYTAAVSEDEAADPPVLITEDSQSDPDDVDLPGSTASSGSDSEVVRQNSRRIRGVLPASWLRLDQQQSKPAARNVKRRTPEPSPDRTVRRGLALPRQGSPKPPGGASLMVFDESEESENELPRRPTESADDPARVALAAVVIDEDDGASVIEEDTIDWMLPGRKRSYSRTISGRAKRQKRSGTQSVFHGRPNVPSRQPKITQVLPRAKHGVNSTSANRKLTHRQHQKGGTSVASRNISKRAASPPLLSILDVVEPDAPRFVRLAARAVRRKSNLGKASPSNKVISLASRNDNVDALSVLRDWKSGKTKPKIPAPLRIPVSKPKRRPALREISSNTMSRPRGPRPHKLIRQSNLDSFVIADEGPQEGQPPERPLASAISPRRPLQGRHLNFHPAQLEEEEAEERPRQLIARKRTLDALYRRRRRTFGASTDDGLDQILDVNFTLQEPAAEGQGDEGDIEPGARQSPTPTEGRARAGRRRFRKTCPPQRVDLDAPQYTRANDPLPPDFSDFEPRECLPQDRNQAQDKLRGLGPYGTHYTHHFEVFPLDMGVFFHESTVIGRGLVRDAVDLGLSDRIRHQRPLMSFSLDGRDLRWSRWDDNTSSELGILVDWIAEQLAPNAAANAGFSQKTIEAAEFVLGYVLRSLSVSDEHEEKAFVSRWLEVLSSFIGRFESSDWNTGSEETKTTQLEVAIRFCLATSAVRSISQASNADPVQSTKLDGLLKQSASATIKRLLECGTKELRDLYGDLQRPSPRERGIRSHHLLANCWVVMMRVLESAAIPRSSFWDVTQSVMLSGGVISSSDCQLFERLWQDMFTLLPLTEVDDSGLVVPGMRHTAPMEGWTLPQQLLKRVFQLYQTNPRQPPGFNDYCRALVARCHLLVQQWGWRKCTGIIGTIFDFFGSQNLEHLRNEEVYKSPRFLEELDGSPSLDIEPEDRCFHIFIKLLALTIQRLKELNRPNDIRNLVTRTLPNHNRQYLKENMIHHRDLAALRNHHDLLCTLFWVSPPELRREVHEIEDLIVPGSAHKEACLISVRAWNQLARFVIAKDEGGDAFRPLAMWRNNIFNQVLDQYLSAASDIEQQFRALSSEMPGISKDVRDDMVAKNKATALDVLHHSVKASLDVLQRAPTLGAALYGLNTGQLQKVFTSLDYQSPGFDWGILRVALDTIEHLLGRIDQASEEQFSSEFDDNLDAPFLEDAVLLVNEHLTKDFFWMARTTLALSQESSARRHNQQVACAEKTVTLAARIAARFVKSRVTHLLSFFSTGKYGLFPDLPHNMTTPDRRYLPLFLAVLVKNHVFDLKDLGINMLGMWMLAIVKPLRYLRYENYLAEVLQHRDLPFLERATVAVGIPPDYNSNADFFACAIHHMRKSLRECGSVRAKQLREEFRKTLQLVMQKMKEDLALLRSHGSEHGPYIEFVRQVVSLIKSHGVNICAVDPFFMQPSADYSPSLQDPQLHTAGIVAYGVKLSEGDTTATQPLFHYLFNNFKVSLGNDKLEQECKILSRAMRNGHVTSFMLQCMIPAIIQASTQAPDCWALLEVYAVAFQNMLESSWSVPKELGHEDMEHVLGIVTSILAWFQNLGCTASPSLQQLHVMALLATLANTLQPSVASYLFNKAEGGTLVTQLQEAVDRLAALFSELGSHLGDVLSRASGNDVPQPEIGLSAVLGALPPVPPQQQQQQPTSGGAGNPRVEMFANTIISDVRQNWVVTADRVMVRMASPGRMGTTPGGPPLPSQAAVSSSAAASLRGACYGPWETRAVLERLRAAVGGWMLRSSRDGGRGEGKLKRGKEMVDLDLLF
ncbi:Mus7/MMS22 family-domain-containing protein [Thermothelomyces heterothallicus CBS 202.75]|uniref:Mus7/MMS22 family-domain-containing protein n=1 Tax=Thermothelomyces heterothallicus CBS 202.75 TaxID=1149848 RepID=UPI00374208DF